MSWTSMHYAVGMGCAGVVTGTACLIFRRGWRFLPLAMTAGGVWALVPDMPRVFREDFPSLPFAGLLGSRSLEHALHGVGDLFCFHGQLDTQPRELALAGLAIILILYNLSIGLLMFLEHRQRDSIGNRAWNAHRHSASARGRRSHRRHGSNSHDPSAPDTLRAPLLPQLPPSLPPMAAAPPMPPLPTAPVVRDDQDPVIHRINPDNKGETA